ncbi:hypothetical protein Peur_018666 [Populus x canadensis]
MDSKIIHAACMGAAVTVIATGVAIIEQERNRNYIPREPCQNQRFRFISGIYYRSVETIHRYFRIVLQTVLKLYKHLIKDPGDTVPAEILNNRRFYPYFKFTEHSPENKKELFNLRHSSLRTAIERGFVDPNDFLMEEICSESEPIRRTINLSQREEREENREWITKREMIASTMWNDYNTQRNYTTQNEKCKGKHFTWSKPMSHMLLEILAEEALKGNKPSSTFRAESFVKVATEISQKFNVQCEPKHVDNNLKTVKKEWGIITKLKNKSGFGWDDCLKMITVSKDVYDEEYLNKKLDMYEAMTIVVGKDMATGNYAKSYADVNLEENTEEQSISIENEGEYEETSKGKETSSSTTQKRQHRKRNRMYEDDGVEKLSKQIGDVALAIQSLSKNQLDVNALYAEVMKIEGFDEITLGEAFDHLVQNEMLAKAFMAKNANLRKIWVQNFVNQHYYRPAC